MAVAGVGAGTVAEGVAKQAGAVKVEAASEAAVRVAADSAAKLEEAAA
jgi:hypothetical protein